MTDQMTPAFLDKTGTSVTVNWAHTGAAYLQYSIYSAFYFTWIDVLGPDGSKTLPSGPFVVAGLTPATRYVFRVASTTDGLFSMAKEIITLTKDEDYHRLIAQAPVLAKEISTMMTELEQLRSNTSKSEVTRLMRERDSVQQELFSVRRLYDEKLRIIGEKQHMITELQTKLSLSHHETESSGLELASLQHEVTTLRESVAELQTRLEYADELHAAELHRWELSKSEADLREKKLNKKIEHLSDDAISTLEHVREHAAKTEHELMQQLAETKKANESRLLELNATIDEGVSSFNSMRAKVAKTEQELILLERELMASREESRALEHELDATCCELGTSRIELKHERDAHSAELASTESTIESLRKSLDESNIKLAKAYDDQRIVFYEREALVAERDAHSADIERLRVAITEAFAQRDVIIHDSDFDIGCLREEINRLRDSVADAIAQRDDAISKLAKERETVCEWGCTTALASLRADVKETEHKLALAIGAKDAAEAVLKNVVKKMEENESASAAVECDLKSHLTLVHKMLPAGLVCDHMDCIYGTGPVVLDDGQVPAQFTKPKEMVAFLMGRDSAKEEIDIMANDLKRAGEEIARLTELLNKTANELECATELIEKLRDLTVAHQTLIAERDTAFTARIREIETFLGSDVELCAKPCFKPFHWGLRTAEQSASDVTNQAIAALHADNATLMAEVARLKDLMCQRDRDAEEYWNSPAFAALVKSD